MDPLVVSAQYSGPNRGVVSAQYSGPNRGVDVEKNKIELPVNESKKISWSDVVRNNHLHPTRVSNVSTGKISPTILHI